MILLILQTVFAQSAEVNTMSLNHSVKVLRGFLVNIGDVSHIQVYDTLAGRAYEMLMV